MFRIHQGYITTFHQL